MFWFDPMVPAMACGERKRHAVVRRSCGFRSIVLPMEARKFLRRAIASCPPRMDGHFRTGLWVIICCTAPEVIGEIPQKLIAPLCTLCDGRMVICTG